MINMNIIEMQVDNDTMPMDFIYDIKFFGDLDVPRMIELAKGIIQEVTGDEPTTAEMIKKWTGLDNSLDELVKELRGYYIDEEDWEKFQTIEDFLEYDEEYFLDKILENDRDLIRQFFEVNDITFDTVGYSPWSYFLAYKDVSLTYITDLYEGWHFYTLLHLDESGEVIDSIGEVYLGEDSYTLAEAVKDHFGLDDFYLVDNEESTYQDHKKVKATAYTTYSFKVID